MSVVRAFRRKKIAERRKFMRIRRRVASGALRIARRSADRGDAISTEFDEAGEKQNDRIETEKINNK